MLGEQGQSAMTVPPYPSISLVLAANPLAVRAALQALFDGFPLNTLDDDARGTVEIVLAEVLNNIVEHAYADFSGDIALTIDQIGTSLQCCFRDSGRAMPDSTLPKGNLQPFDGCHDAPEGGFGWHLIRALASDLSYRREGESNLLQFRLDLKGSNH